MFGALNVKKSSAAMLGELLYMLTVKVYEYVCETVSSAF